MFWVVTDEAKKNTPDFNIKDCKIDKMIFYDPRKSQESLGVKDLEEEQVI